MFINSVKVLVTSEKKHNKNNNEEYDCEIKKINNKIKILSYSIFVYADNFHFKLLSKTSYSSSFPVTAGAWGNFVLNTHTSPLFLLKANVVRHKNIKYRKVYESV